MSISTMSLFAFIPGFGKTKKGETLKENAARFVRAVRLHARDHRVIDMTPDKKTGAYNYLGNWVAMKNDTWRHLVLTMLREEKVKEAQFLPPDTFGDWSFLAISTVPVDRIEMLTEDEVL